MEVIEVNGRDAWGWEETDMSPGDGQASSVVADAGRIVAGFEAGLRVGWDWLGSGAADAIAVVRAAQCGAAGLLAAMVDAGVSFDVPAHGDEVCGKATCLITEALWGWGGFDHAVGGDAVLAVYADTVGALLRGGASRCVVSPVSMAASWPVVRAVWQRHGVRLTGWATPEFQRECWATVEADRQRWPKVEAAAAVADVEAVAA